MSTETATEPKTRRISTRTLIISGVIVAIVLAGLISGFASSHPDGLEYVAEQLGFHSTAQDSAAATGPLADYGVSGVENARLSGGLAGIIGVAVVAVVMGGLVWLLRRSGSRQTATRATDPEA
ncbi:PDGLE domain-containing protein [Kribbia dieselivorans]|uniref:PDGLE domain-containing protein n=1 Tax=Kribbia dieselivorans TaxID=331526 RepID=UPI0012ED00CF|nr:PDGLE domain-containing protein [Kribbia dieselivorans]